MKRRSTYLRKTAQRLLAIAEFEREREKGSGATYATIMAAHRAGVHWSTIFRWRELLIGSSLNNWPFLLAPRTGFPLASHSEAAFESFKRMDTWERRAVLRDICACRNLREDLLWALANSLDAEDA